MPANLEKSEVVTGLEKVSFHSNPKERQWHRMFKLPHNCTHLMHYQKKRKWSHSVIFNSLRPHRRQSIRLPRPWDSPGKNTGVGCHFLLQCVKVKSESEVAQSCPTLSDPMDCSLPGFSVHGILDECNCAVVWTFFGIAFLLDWNENWPFPVLWPLLSFPNLLAYWMQHFHSILF